LQLKIASGKAEDLAMVIPWPGLTTPPGAILSATPTKMVGDGAIFAHRYAGQDLHGITMPRPVQLGAAQK
jgi:hypothetical protein